jgi:hypothetical protein
MDDIAVNPDLYDPFREPVLLAVAGAFLLVILLLRLFAPRKTDAIVYLGAFMVTTVALDPVLRYAYAEARLVWRQTAVLRQIGSADPLRERDPLFGLLQMYLKANPAHPLVVVDDEKGETARWAAYYLAPRPIVRASERILADAVPAPGDPPRWVLTGGGMPALPENADVNIEGRVGNWILLRLQGKEGP